MPAITRYFIKAAILYFGAGLLTSFLVSAQKMLNLPSFFQSMTPTYLHMLVVGWITQLIIGVAYWMFPKYSKEQPRGNEKVGWVVLIALNAGLILRTIGEPLAALMPDKGYGWLLVLASLLLLIAGWGFVFNTWSRVKEH